jgi:hypothetical protein
MRYYLSDNQLINTGLFHKNYFIENVRLSLSKPPRRWHFDRLGGIPLSVTTSRGSATEARCDKTCIIYAKFTAF